MAITSAPLQSVSPAAGLTAPSGSNPLSMQSIATPNVNPATLTNSMNPQGVVNTLAQNAPQSLTSLLMPLYSQLFGSQTGALAQNEQLQSQQGVASAQSNAQQRGLTGSSIEAGAMQGAQASAQNAYTQGYASLLGNYVNQYAGAAGQDVSNQQSYYSNLAQALGQGYNSQVQQSEFQQQLQASLQAASEQAKATEWGGAFSGVGALAGGLLHSDIRLKKDVREIGRRFGFKVYSYLYDHSKSKDAATLLMMPPGRHVGFMAHHVAEKYPEVVKVVNGFLAIDYGRLAKILIPQEVACA